MTEFATSGKARIAFEVTGDGPDVLLVHAGVNDRRGWRHVVEQLSPDFRCIAPDRGPEAETPDAWPRFGEIAVPTLVLVGRLDAEEVVTIAPQVAERIPHAGLEHLDGVAHVPHLEGDEATLRSIRTFAYARAQR